MGADLQLRVLLFRDGDQWVAQVLERDVAAHGPTEYAALTAVQLVVQAHVNFDTRHQRPPLSRLSQAPERFWHAYRGAQPLPFPQGLSSFWPAAVHPAVSTELLAS